MIEHIEYGELESLLRDWVCMEGEGAYDFEGMFHLFRACLLNLMDHSTEEDWLQAVELLELPERVFLSKLVRRFQSA